MSNMLFSVEDYDNRIRSLVKMLEWMYKYSLYSTLGNNSWRLRPCNDNIDMGDPTNLWLLNRTHILFIIQNVHENP